MQQHIGIAMADRVSVMGNFDAADPKWSARREPVSIVANANPLVRRLGSLSDTSDSPGCRGRLESLSGWGR